MSAADSGRGDPRADAHAASGWAVAPDRTVDLSRSALVAVLNVTPDSFSDGGELVHPAAVAWRAERMALEGAAVLDVGGESTRPGASRVPAGDQIARVVPAIRAIRDAGVRLPITIDTTLAEVAEAALDAGADAINDVSAGGDSDDATIRVAAERGCGIVLMHRLRAPQNDVYSHKYEREPNYDAAGGVVSAVRTHLLERAGRAAEIGVAPGAVAIDPGLGFGKSVAQNLALLREASAFVRTGLAVFAGASRKSFVGKVTNAPRAGSAARLPGSLAAAALLHGGGVRLIRVHDVAEHARLLALLDAAGDAVPRSHGPHPPAEAAPE